MTLPFIRKDYLIDRWVIFAPERAKRPMEFKIGPAKPEKIEKCPFCPGNEDKTPPATLLYLLTDRGIRKGKDSDRFRPKNWLIRCFPNLFPALRPSGERESEREVFFQSITARGFHEVLVESPRHYEHPGVARVKQLELVISAIIDRMKYFYTHDYIKYVSVFRNHGKMAGASLSHAHLQIIAMPIVPRLIVDELNAARRFFDENKECPFCQIIEKELEGPRIIYDNDHFVALTPWASVYPYEFWILPKRHSQVMMDITLSERRSFANAIRTCFGNLVKKLNDPPYSFGYHFAPARGKWDFYHWHLETYPKLSFLGGLEKSAGMFINTVFPESAAELLRES